MKSQVKIEKIEIYGYGKWTQKSFSNLQEMQVFLGQNEAGKSTLASFIHTMFFGFPSRRKKDTNTYEPKKGERYGGRLTLSGTRYGKITIERIKNRDRDRATLTHENGSQEVVENLSRYLLGVDRATYDDLYTFQIDRLLNLRDVKKEELNRYLLGVGTSGSELLLNVADSYQKDALKSFKPSGRRPELNQKLIQAEELWAKLQVAKQKNDNYQTLLLQAAKIKEKLEMNQDSLTHLEEENRSLSEAIRLNDYYQEWLQLNKIIEAVDTSFLPADAAKRWERLQIQMSDDFKKMSALNAYLQEEKKHYASFEHLEWYQTHQPEWQSLKNEVNKVSNLFTKEYALTNQLHQEEADLVAYKRQHGLGDEISILDADQEAEIKQLLEEEEHLQADISLVSQGIAQSDAELETLEKRIKEVEGNQENGKNRPQETKKIRKQPILWGLALLALLVAFIYPDLRIYTIAVAVFMIVLSVLPVKEKTPTEAYIAQETLASRLRDLKEDEEAAQERLLHYLNDQERLEMEQSQVRQSQKSWLEAAHYPSDFSLRRILEENPAAHLDRLERKLTQTVTQLEETELAIVDWYTRTAFIRKHFQLEYLDSKAFFERFADLYGRLEIEGTKAKNSAEKIADLKAEQQEIQKQLDANHEKRNELLENAHVSNEAEFYQLIQAKEDQVKQKQRRDFLAEQLEGKEALLARYPDKKRAINKLETNKEKLLALQTKRTQMQEEEVSLRHEILVLEEGGTYSSLLQEYAILETELREMIIDWGKKMVAAEWLENTLRHGKENRLPMILEDMNDYFSRLTQAAYKQIIFQKSGLKIRHQDNTVYEPFELSQGTIEQLYIAMRFAFIKNTADIANLPILIDDGFVNFDQERKNTVYQLLNELSETVQVFFFTFDQRIREKFSEDEISMLN